MQSSGFFGIFSWLNGQSLPYRREQSIGYYWKSISTLFTINFQIGYQNIEINISIAETNFSSIQKKVYFPYKKITNKNNQNRLPKNLYLLTLSLLIKSTYGSFLHRSFKQGLFLGLIRVVISRLHFPFIVSLVMVIMATSSSISVKISLFLWWWFLVYFLVKNYFYKSWFEANVTIFTYTDNKCNWIKLLNS